MTRPLLLLALLVPALLPAALVPAALLPAALLPAALVPAALLPAALVPAALVPAALVPAALVPGRADDASVVSLPQARPAAPVRFQFGTLDPATRPQVSHVFLLRNAGPAPLTLGELDPSCRCTTATIETPSGDLPTLAPGGQVAVRVTIVFEALLTGPLTKDVWVYAQGSDRPLADLELSGVLRPPKPGPKARRGV